MALTRKYERKLPQIPNLSESEYDQMRRNVRFPPALSKALTPRQEQVFVIRMHQDNPLTLEQVSEKMGIGVTTVRSYWSDIRSRCKRLGIKLPDMRESGSANSDIPTGRITTEGFLREIEPALFQIVHEMRDRCKVKEAKLRDLGSAARELVNIRALLSGEPTQIIAHEQREGMNEMAALIANELRRRGIAQNGFDPRTGEPIFEKSVTVDVESVEA